MTVTKKDVPGLPAADTLSRRDALRFGALATAVTILPSGIARAGAAKRLRFAHPAPTAHGWHVWAEHFKTAFEGMTDGRFTVQLFPDAQMGNERDTAQAVRLGSIEMGAIGVGLMNWVPQMSVTDAPFLWRNRAHAYAAIEGPFGDALRKAALEKGFRLVGWTDLGFRCMTNNVKVITSADDMKGLKMRVPNAKAYIALMQALGSATVAVDLSELYLALRQGVADGQDTPPSVVKSNKLYEVQKFVSKTDHVLTTAYVVANPAFFDGLAAADKEAFLKASQAADEHLRAHTQADEAKAYGFLGENGMQVTTDVDGESFRRAAASVLSDNPDLFPPDLIKIAQAVSAA
jgi:tripartite ATP-independent transporter DctP family solute receptor